MFRRHQLRRYNPEPPPYVFSNWHVRSTNDGDAYVLYALTVEGQRELQRGIVDWPLPEWVLGNVKYHIPLNKKKVSINWIGVKEPYRRQHLGSALWQEMKRLYPDYFFPAFGLTAEGAALRKAVGMRRVRYRRNMGVRPTSDAKYRRNIDEEIRRVERRNDLVSQASLFRNLLRAGRTTSHHISLVLYLGYSKDIGDKIGEMLEIPRWDDSILPAWAQNWAKLHKIFRFGNLDYEDIQNRITGILGIDVDSDPSMGPCIGCGLTPETLDFTHHTSCECTRPECQIVICDECRLLDNNWAWLGEDDESTELHASCLQKLTEEIPWQTNLVIDFLLGKDYPLRKKRELERRRRNPAVPIQKLTTEEFIDEMNRQDLAGKHGKTQSKWEIVANYEQRRSTDKDRPFILIHHLPIRWLEMGHEIDLELAESYEQLETLAPPIFVRLSSFRLARDPSALPVIENGHHRVEAAKRRGETVINAIVSQETWKNIREQGF